MSDIVVLNFWQFAIVYLLLLVVIGIMKKCNIDHSKLLIIGSIRMTVQLVLAALVLTYIFDNPNPIFTVIYMCAMTTFAIFTVFNRVKNLSKRWKVVVALALSFIGLGTVIFFIYVIVGVNIFNPRYTIPLGGMIIGNAMTGLTIGLRTFKESVRREKLKIDTLINLGVSPKDIFTPFVNKSLETALLPTINSMLGMGIISLPGMMTGQILSGTMPTTAILYQISIIITICTVTCLSVFFTLYYGAKALYNNKNQIIYSEVD